MTADKRFAIEGETVTLTLDLQPGYEFLECYMNPDTEAYTQVNDTTFTFVMPDCDAEAFVYLEKAEYYVSLGGEESNGVTFLLDGEPKDTAPFPAQYGDWITVLFSPEDQMISAMTYTYTDNGKTVTNTLSFIENGNHVEGRFRMPNGDVTVRLEFSKDNVFATAPEGTTFDYTVEKVGSRYRVQITGIGAHELGTVFTLTTGETTISASAMTYVQQSLANANASTAAKNAAAALYAYYQEAMNYRNGNN